MHSRNLAHSGHFLQNGSMRLPQSKIRSCFLSFRALNFLALGMAFAMLGMVPISGAQTAPLLACSPASLRFGTVDLGQSETQLVTLTNTGGTSLTISAISTNNPEFATSSLKVPLVIPPGQSVDLNVSFTPSAVEWTGGTIQFTSNGSNSPLLFQLAGTGVSTQALTASPAILSFGAVTMGSKASLPVTITNVRSSSVPITGIQSVDAEFSISGLPAFPMTLNPGQSIALNVTFTPQSTGEVGGSVFIFGPRLNIPLTGTGTSVAAGQLTIAPASLSFGNVTVGSTGIQSMSLSASGGSVTVNSATSSNSQFVLDGAAFPFTIGAGQSVSLNVAFTPQGAGSDSASLSFSSNASNSQATGAMTGTGTAATFSVNLSWNASSDVTGYNVYRSTSAKGPYARINSTLDANTAYTDTTVTGSNTYYYEATSVNSSGTESAPSTPPVVAAVP